MPGAVPVSLRSAGRLADGGAGRASACRDSTPRPLIVHWCCRPPPSAAALPLTANQSERTSFPWANSETG